jgi:hypothetical protein
MHTFVIIVHPGHERHRDLLYRPGLYHVHASKSWK